MIDSSMVHDPRSVRLYLFWAEQHSSIWVGELSADGLSLAHHIHQALWARDGWERVDGCSVEGPEEIYRDGWFYLFYSGASTWAGSYAVGVAVAADPLESHFVRLSTQPILRSGPSWLGPGGTSSPVTDPNGVVHLFYHALRRPGHSHISEYATS